MSISTVALKKIVDADSAVGGVCAVMDALASDGSISHEVCAAAKKQIGNHAEVLEGPLRENLAALPAKK